MTSQSSGRLYSLVTKQWHRVAAGVVVVIGFFELVIGGLTTDSRIDLYLTAWAATTAGIWFLFEKAETALSIETREKVAGWVRERELQSGIGSISGNFTVLFDRVFGERHLSWRCFFRSSLASLVFVLCVYLGAASFTLDNSIERSPEYLPKVGDVRHILWYIAFFNLIPDYLSLLETRWAITWARSSGRFLWVIVADAVLTGLISAAFIIGVVLTPPLIEVAVTPVTTGDLTTRLFGGELSGWLRGLFVDFGTDPREPGFAIFFYSAFFTSIWLWLYAASVLLSRLLLRMNDGLGFMLRVTDVERQPFRSMGFVGVVIVSTLFALGLPLLLLF